jgi:hypothetical protein
MCSNEELAARLDSIESIVQQSDRALRGSNGVTGIAADVELLKNEQQHIKSSLENELRHLVELIRVRDEKTVKWPDILWRFVAPVVVAISSSWLTAKLLLDSMARQ